MSSGVEFEEDKFMGGHAATPPRPNSGPNLGYGRPQLPSNTSKMTIWLMKHGIKSERGAQIVLFGVIIFNIIVTFLVISYLL